MFAAESGRSLLSGVVVEQVDFDSKEGAEWTRRHRVLGLPTVLVLDEEGLEQGRIEGYSGAREFREELGAILRGRAALWSDPTGAESALERGRDLLVKGHEAEGLAMLEQARRLPGSEKPDVQVKVAQLLGRYWIRVMKTPEPGIKALRGVLQKFPEQTDSVSILYWVAQGWMVAGDSSRALEVLQEMVEAADSDRALRFRAFFLLRHNLGPDLVGRDLRSVLTRSPDSANTHHLMARHLGKIGECVEARTHAAEAVRLDDSKAAYADTLAAIPFTCGERTL